MGFIFPISKAKLHTLKDTIPNPNPLQKNKNRPHPPPVRAAMIISRSITQEGLLISHSTIHIF